MTNHLIALESNEMTASGMDESRKREKTRQEGKERVQEWQRDRAPEKA